MLWVLTSILLGIIAIYTEGTNGNGDSIYHFQYSRYAINQPELYFDHWAKPFFTMLSSGFSQFGFIGIKIFNIICTSLSMLFVYKIAKQLNFKYAILVLPIYVLNSLFFNTTFSGLTEPLSALMLCVGIFMLLNNQTAFSIIVISFLPFVRSEGLIISLVFLFYLFLQKKYKFIPLILFGHLIMSIAGYFYYHDFLWIFNKIPYAHIDGVYGNGTWIHYFIQLYFALGPIIYCLLFIGIQHELVKAIIIFPKFDEKFVLIYGTFLTFFIAHVLFWALGIFNSLGLIRVFATMLPVICIISIDSLNKLYNQQNKVISRWLFGILTSLLIVFPFLSNPASINFKNSLELDPSQKFVKNELVPYLQNNFPNHRYLVADVSIPYFLNVNPFDTNLILNQKYHSPLNNFAKNDVLIWDNWFSSVEAQMKDLDSILMNKQFVLDTTFSTINIKNDTIKYSLFISK